jgi:hypothetical protein
VKYAPTLLVTTVFLCLQLATALPVFACESEFQETTLQEHVDTADLIVIGTVTDEIGGDPYEGEFTIQVESYLKGEGPDVILIIGFGSGVGDCGDQILVGERWVFLVDGNPETDRILRASSLKVSDSLHSASDTNVKTISDLVGHEPVFPSPTPLQTRMKYWMRSSEFETAIIVGIPGFVLVAGIALGLRLKRRSAKKKNSQ